MTDHLKEAAIAALTEVSIDRVPSMLFTQDEATRIVEALANYLRSTPTAPTRTEEKRFVSGSHVYKHYGVEESPDAEGSEGPGDEELRAIEYRGLVSLGREERTTVAAHNEGRRSVWRDGFAKGRSSAARELAEKYSSQDPLLVHEGTIECDHCGERSKAYGGAADSATICPVRARALTGELAELREKVRAFETLARWAIEQPSLPSTIYRELVGPGSGSDEGKATT
ncbi:MAG TPA: hypothetical protein VGK73_32630 [Polyangiaceae bacterium]